MDIDAIFGTTGNTGALQECARALAIAAYGVVIVRLVGRRVFARWSALDIVVAIVSGSSLSRALTGNADLWGTLAAVTLLMAVHWALARAMARSPRLSRWIEGPAVRLSRDGEMDERALLRHGVSAADLQEALRSAGVESAGEVRAVVLEPSGKISVLKAPE